MLQSGGVALDTARWAARVESRLTLAGVRARDAGAYSCSAAGRAATLALLLDDDDDGESPRTVHSCATYTDICLTSSQTA